MSAFSDAGTSKTRLEPNFSLRPIVVPKIPFGSVTPNPKDIIDLSSCIAFSVVKLIILEKVKLII